MSIKDILPNNINIKDIKPINVIYGDRGSAKCSVQLKLMIDALEDFIIEYRASSDLKKEVENISAVHDYLVKMLEEELSKEPTKICSEKDALELMDMISKVVLKDYKSNLVGTCNRKCDKEYCSLGLTNVYKGVEISDSKFPDRTDSSDSKWTSTN